MFELTVQHSRPLVTVIVPAHNYGHYISQTLDSVLAQSCQDWECLVIDDGSTDHTRDVVSRYAETDPRIKYTYQSNQGLAAARNNGLRQATGRYIQFLDADDMLEFRKLERHVNYLEQHPEVDIVYGSVRYFTTEAPAEWLFTMWGKDEPWMPGVSGQGKDLLLALVDQNIMVVNAPLLRKSVTDKIGFFDSAPKGVEDWDYWLRCAVQGLRFQYDDSEGTLALVRSHPSSMSRDRRGMLRGALTARKKMNSLPVAEEVLKLNREQIALFEASLGIEEVRYGRYLQGGYYLIRAGRASGRKTWILCGLISPILPKNRFEELVYTSLSVYVRGLIQKKLRPGRESS